MIAVLFVVALSGARAEPVTIVVLGDSLTAGYGLGAEDAFPAKLQMALARSGIEAVVINAGVSGDTSAGGLARLAWSMDDGPDLAIIELGANDALRGLAPEATYENLAAILQWLDDQEIPSLLTGMLAPPNMGEEYGRAFNAIYPRLAEYFSVELYPFFLDGVAANPALLQEDGMHPNSEGVDVIAAGVVPYVVDALKVGITN
ncbi:MAG: arylesterase [Alphaproteobacteria bacterium]|jgi:acyl-CoA thioesterase I|nr:arylesterase [Alphaproteobacteria bacterium]MBT4710625.1 arylesterase [Alphaproteobacteria bacterium]MBT5860531.1 arylesterase [Alphaproteobacteria bacterium]